MMSACAVCGQPTGVPSRVANLEDLMAEFAQTHEKELKVTTVDGNSLDGTLEGVYGSLMLLRQDNQRKVWVPLDKVVTIMEGRSRPR